MSVHDALALVEVDAIATGLAAVDALTKRAAVTIRGAGVVEPGRYVIITSGPLADLEEAHDAALRRVGRARVDDVLLPAPADGLWEALAGRQQIDHEAACVGVIEGTTLAGTVLACDRAIKDATVALAGLRLTPGLGGRAWFVVTGHLHDVEASVAVARGKLGARLWRAEVIARPSPELLSVLLAPGTLSVEGGGWNKRA